MITFTADGLTLHGTYRHRRAGQAGPAALLISESTHRPQRRQQRRRADRQHATACGVSVRTRHATLRYDKVGTGATGLGALRGSPADVGSAVSTGAKAAIRFLAGKNQTERNPDLGVCAGRRDNAMRWLADDSSAGAPKVHSLALLQQLPGAIST